MLELFNYNAGRGDCIRIRYKGTSGQYRNIIIDSGVERFGPRFRSVLEEIENNKEQIDAMILTHEDSDHIGGLLYNLRRKSQWKIQQVWMNHGMPCPGQTDLSARQNDLIYTSLLQRKIPVFPAAAGWEREIDGGFFRILWPEKEILDKKEKGVKDTALCRKTEGTESFQELMEAPIRYRDNSRSNRRSVVFEFEYQKVKMLFTGDAWPQDVVKSAGGRSYDLVKIPHHGSVRNISEEWRDAISSRNFMICTDGIKNPDRQTIAKLNKWYGDICIWGSVPWWKGWNLPEEKKMEIHFMEGEKVVWKI